MDYDESQAFDTTNNEYVAPETGKYRIEGHAMIGSFTGTGAFQFRAQLKSSGGTLDEKKLMHVDTAYGLLSPDVSAHTRLTKGDSVWMAVFHNTGASESLRAGEGNTKFLVERIE